MGTRCAFGKSAVRVVRPEVVGELIAAVDYPLYPHYPQPGAAVPPFFPLLSGTEVLKWGARCAASYLNNYYLPAMQRLTQSWRWYGPQDPVPLAHIRQAGSTDVVSALHDIPNGAVWPEVAIRQHQALIAAAGLRWSVVESVPVHEAIKRRTGEFERYVANYCTTLQHLGACGIEVVTYNFMPVVDWTRTHLDYRLPDGSEALYFDKTAFAAFELFELQRTGAEADYSAAERDRAAAYYAGLDAAARAALARNITAGLPGGTTEAVFSLDRFRTALAGYADTDAARLRDNLIAFLEVVVPVAEACGVRLALHPDDPPYPLLGLPRVVSTAADVQALFDAVPSPANGLCFCTGSFGVRPDNDLPAMVDQFAERIHFVHLRSTHRDENGNFYEADHLAGDVDMYAVMRRLLAAAERQGRHLPMRPDHGHRMLDDLQKVTNPGYSAIGRLRGLAELRGLEMGILRSLPDSRP